jgi:ankyrin repeat protein
VDEVDRLIAACIALDAAGVHRILAANRGSKAELGRSDHALLCWAIRNGRYDAVPLLLEAGLDPNVPDNHGETPLHLAVKASQAGTVAILKAHGASSEARNFQGLTPFAEVLDADERREKDELFEQAAKAVVDGNLDELRELLDQDPDLVHARSPRAHRATLLHYVAANGVERQEVPPNASKIAELLLERGAEPDAECYMYGGGETTLGLVVSSIHPEQAGLTGEIVRVLVKGGAKIAGHRNHGDAVSGAIDARSKLGLEALIQVGAAETLCAAAALGHLDVLERRLLESSGPLGEAIVVAAKFGQIQSLEKLVMHAADLNTELDGATALHWAAYHGEKAAVLWLLDHGGDPTLKDKMYGGTAAGWASHAGHAEIAELIQGFTMRQSAPGHVDA